MNIGPRLILCAASLLPLNAISETPGTWTQQIVASDNHKYLCHVVPRGSYPDPSGAPASKAYATLFYLPEANPPAGFYRPLWRRELPNSVAPLTTRISTDGQFLVMIGDYDAPTSGRIIIYSGMADTSERSGQLLASTSFKEVLTAAELARIPPIDDRRYWSGTHRIDAATKTLILQVFSGGDALKPEYAEVRLDLRTGKRLQ